MHQPAQCILHLFQDANVEVQYVSRDGIMVHPSDDLLSHNREGPMQISQS